MPELPDLQVYKKNLEKKLLNKKIEKIEIYNTKKIVGDTMPLLKLDGTISIFDINRIGKELIFNLTNDTTIGFHLMLKGEFSIDSHNNLEQKKYKIFEFVFEDNQGLLLTDPQGLAKVTINPEINNVPDALSNEFDFSYFIDKVNDNSRKNIKAFLLDQNIVKGIGNAYADEVLWHSKISPESKVGKIPAEKLQQLYTSIKVVLQNAIEQIDILSPDIISGETRSFLKVHNSAIDRTENGEEIIVKKIASKKTYFTASQELFK